MLSHCRLLILGSAGFTCSKSEQSGTERSVGTWSEVKNWTCAPDDQAKMSSFLPFVSILGTKSGWHYLSRILYAGNRTI
jgi:hypothetical protein